ncbi:MAG: universal stress protein [Bacteroidota bacterium]
MNKEKNTILVTWDFSEVSEYALAHAVRIGKLVENRVMLFHIVKEESEIVTAKNKLSQAVIKLSEKYGCELNYVCLAGKIFDVISEFASNEENKVNMVFMGTHGMKGSQKLFGSWALKVIAGSNVPFIVVQRPPVENERFTNIVFPIDFKSENKEKLQWAIYLGKYMNSKVHLYKSTGIDKHIQKKINVNLNFAIRFLIQNNIEYEIHDAPRTKNFPRDVVDFAKSIHGDLILITTTKHITMVDYLFGAQEQFLIANPEGIPVMCVNPKSNFAKVGQFMYG